MNDIASTQLDAELRPLLDTFIDAVIVLSKEGIVAGWNSVAELTFGWSADEAIGRNLTELIIPEIHRRAHKDGMDRLRSGGKAKVLNRRIELPARCKDGSDIPVELSITTTHDKRYFIGFLRNISERRMAEDLLKRQLREFEILLDITQRAGESQSVEDAMRLILKTVCEATGWTAGHAFMRDRNDPDVLRASNIWHEKTADCAAQMKLASKDLIFRIGEGLPGDVLAKDGPVWLSDIDKSDNFIRRGFEFRGAFGFPLRNRGRTIAVLEFFSDSPIAPDDAQLVLAQAIGGQLGRVIERSEASEQREVLLNELNHRSKNLLTVVQAIARVTFSGIEGAQDRLETFTSRLSAMARAQDLLVNGQWSDSTMDKVVDAALAGFSSYKDRFSISGPELPVAAAEVQNSVLTLHELCTNALKYGALSDESGRIEISWGFEHAHSGQHFYFKWKEFGCKNVKKPDRSGFGTNLLKRGISSSPNSRVQIDYNPEGVCYVMYVPVSG